MAISIEEQLERLQDCGIQPDSQAAINHWINEWGREDLEERPFELLFHSLGDEYEDADGNWHPSSAGIWHLDTECIYDPNDYVKVATRMMLLTRGDLQLDNIRANLEGESWLRFEHDGTAYDWQIKVDDDWIDISVIDRFAELLERQQSERRYFASVTDTQDCLIVCPTQQEFDAILKLTSEEFTAIRNAW